MSTYRASAHLVREQPRNESEIGLPRRDDSFRQVAGPRLTPEDTNVELARSLDLATDRILSEKESEVEKARNFLKDFTALAKTDVVIAAVCRRLAVTGGALFLGDQFSAYSSGISATSNIILTGKGFQLSWNSSRGSSGRSCETLQAITHEDLIRSGLTLERLKKEIMEFVDTLPKDKPEPVKLDPELLLLRESKKGQKCWFLRLFSRGDQG